MLLGLIELLPILNNVSEQAFLTEPRDRGFTLSDGRQVEINGAVRGMAGASMTVEFAQANPRVHMARGVVHFNWAQLVL